MLLKSIAISSKNFLTKFLKTVENFDTDMMKCTRLMMKPIIIVKKDFLPPFFAPKTFVHLPVKNKLGLKIDHVFTVDIFEALMFSWIFLMDNNIGHFQYIPLKVD